METLHMSVNGEFITDLARTWLWDEKRPFNTCISLLTNCMGGISQNQANEFAIQILEGRKKLVGNNVFSLNEDNEQIRPITNYLLQIEKENVIHQIQLDMQTSFRKYVDVWSTIKSSHPEVLLTKDNPTTFQECVNWYCKEEKWPNNDLIINHMPILDTPTKGGLWLIDYPELVYDCCNGDMSCIGNPEFWHNIYIFTKNRPGFETRNERYHFSLRPKPSLEEQMENLCKLYQKEHQDEPTYLSEEWFAYQLKIEKDITYRMEPDNMECWEGLIAPNGDFYSCRFGSHNQKAYYLILHHPEWIQSTKEEIKHSDTIRIDNGLDILLDIGWCATRSVRNDHYVLPNYPKRPTKAQINRIYQTIIKHNIHINTQELLNQIQ